MKTLYDSDFALWIEVTVQQLCAKHTEDLDWESYQNALKNAHKEYDTQFRDHSPFSADINQLLTEDFYRELT